MVDAWCRPSSTTQVPSTSADKDQRVIRGTDFLPLQGDGTVTAVWANGAGTVGVCSNSGGSWSQARAFESKVKGLAGFSLCSSTGRLALGGEGSDLSVWDLEKGEKAFQAKGAKPNFVGVQDKPLVTCITHLPGSGGSKIVVGTSNYKLRLYDISAQKKPVKEASDYPPMPTSLPCIPPQMPLIHFHLACVDHMGRGAGDGGCRRLPGLLLGCKRPGQHPAVGPGCGPDDGGPQGQRRGGSLHHTGP